ncbi:MAG TPA: FecR domain-containing protein [Longimicrobiales bacterium]|nr:FecR domain-containing protein [Longimicrobiales bacterium]
MSGSSDMEEIARYLAGELTAGDAVALERRAAEDVALGARLRSARTAWAESHPPEMAAPDVDDAWLRLRDATTMTDGVQPLTLPLRARGFRFAPAWSAAAAVLLVAAAALVWQLQRAPNETVVVTVAGEQRMHTLPDGSTVRIGPSGLLRVRTGYGTEHRDVELWGEAYFVAAQHDAPPLTVLAGGARVRDIGTAFIVRAFEDEPVHVVVTQGAVRLSAAGAADTDGVAVHAGQHAAFAAGSGARLLGQADTIAELAWIHGRLVLHDAALDDVARQLQRWYGVTVRIDDPKLTSRRLTATFEGESVDEASAAVARTLGILHERRGDTITFHPLRTQ